MAPVRTEAYPSPTPGRLRIPLTENQEQHAKPIPHERAAFHWPQVTAKLYYAPNFRVGRSDFHCEWTSGVHEDPRLSGNPNTFCCKRVGSLARLATHELGSFNYCQSLAQSW